MACASVKVKSESITVTEKVLKDLPAKGVRQIGVKGREPPPKLYATGPINRPQTATSKLFAPRTEEMNKGFLMFSDEEPGLTSK